MKNKSEIEYPDSYLDWSDKNKSGIIRYVIGLIILILIFFMIGGIGLIPVALLNPNYKDSLVWSNLAMLSIFILPFISVPLTTQLLHRRPYWSVAMPKPLVDMRKFLIGFLVSLLVGVIALALFHFLGLVKINFVGFDFKNYIPLVIIGIIGVFIQTSTEEMLFRGYLTQFVRKITKNPYIFLFIPAILFAAPHISNIAAFGGSPVAILPYLFNGLLFGWAAYKSKSLWMSVGLHMSNNLGGLLLIGISGDKLESVAPFQMGIPSLNITSALILIQVLLTVLILSYYFKTKKLTS